MTSEKMYGVFEYQEKEYPFVLEKQILTIPQVPFQYKDDFKGETYIEAIRGVTNNNRGVVFVGCEVLGSDRIPFVMEVKLSILGYVILENDRTSFDRIEFYSEGINGFYSPRNAYGLEDDGQMRVTGIKTRDKELYKRDYECTIKEERIRLGLNVYMSFNLAFDKKSLGTAESLLSMSFGEKKKPHDILKYSLWKSFKRMIDRADTTLQEKFEACQTAYEAETKESIQRICKIYGIPEKTNLAEAYASFRNQTAHGVIQRPEEVEIATYQILRCFIYAMNLRRADIPTDKIKEVLMRMF